MSVAAKTKTEALPILVIEDEATVVAYVRTALERHGYRVEVSSSAAQALRLLESRRYRGVISDMRTPGGVSGAEVLAWLRQHQPQMTSRLMFITGDIASDETAAILKSSGAPYIEKPFRVQELLVALEALFAAD
jgi:DNA-binding response OmpR family regulator